MISYTALPSSISDGKSYLTEQDGTCGIMQHYPMWSAGSFSNTSIRYELFTNASLRGILIIVGYKS